MNSRFTVLEITLNRAEFRWKWLRFVRLSSVLGIFVSLCLACLGVAVLQHWITDRNVALTLFVIICAIALIAFVLIAIAVMVQDSDRRWLAAAVERIDRRFMDRLNTLLFLEKRRADPRAHSFALRIARQSLEVLSGGAPPPAFSSKPAWSWFTAFAATLVVMLALNSLFSPWSLLRVAQAHPNPAGGAEPPLELALPATNHLEQNQPWGEVRITEPGADLKVTKVDVVPLQIEAAANQRLEQVGWSSTINGAAETNHPLPQPREPRYAIYQPTLYLDELNLSDWDVMTYYAKASTEQSNAYASEVYFLEVRPFREDIAKLPGGESGKAYQQLNEMSGLIDRQQHVIRQTHQHLQSPPPQENLRAQERKKLSDAESDLSDAAQHLYASMAAEMENKPIGDALDNLAKAERSLDAASKSLDQNIMPQAQNQERTALSELVAARKMFQKAISDNPDAFQSNEEPTPVADQSEKLNQMAEFRNEAKAAQDFVQKTLEQQRNLEQRARSAPASQYPKMAQDQQRLQKDLQNFAEQHPQPFKGSEPQARQAQQAMGQAADSMQNKSPDTRRNTQQATRDVEKLAQSMKNQASGKELANAYQLKQMLDQQAQALDERSKPGSQMSDADLQRTAREAKQTIDQLKKTAEEEPTRDAFGQPLRDALSGQNKVDLDSKLLRLQQAEDEAAKQQAAGQASQSLGKVSDAFSASQPKSLQMARQNDSLKPSDGERFNQGMSELQSLIKQLEDNHQSSKENQAKQGQQALADLTAGMRSQYGSNERGEELLKQFGDLLKSEEGLDPGDLSRLLSALQHFSSESSQELAKKEDGPHVSNIDPANLPPAYRSRIQKYFQKLSEK